MLNPMAATATSTAARTRRRRLSTEVASSSELVSSVEMGFLAWPSVRECHQRTAPPLMPEPGSGGQFTLLRFELCDHLAIRPVHVRGNTPDIDSAKQAVRAHAQRRLGCPCCVAPPVAAAAEDDQPADLDVDPVREIDVDVAEEREDVHRH